MQYGYSYGYDCGPGGEPYYLNQPGFRRSGLRGFGYLLPDPPKRLRDDMPRHTRAERKLNKPRRSDHRKKRP